ncbi:MAG TPA: polysaccharide deacetylase family protein [Candidatus Methylacidiphilales bacterium]|nr:polysaccharide deacetylase family protein [Candidatus Methylacidiphilales bacterium]
MFLKRFIILAVGVLLSIGAFVIYFEYSRSQMEERFRAEREKFHINGPLQLTEANVPAETPAPAPNSTGAPSSNTLIGPVPPPASATPDSSSTPTPTPDAGSAPAPAASGDSNATPNPAPADSNAAPATPSAPSTLNFPRQSADVFQFASYRPDLTPFRSAIVVGQTTPSATPLPASAPEEAAQPPTGSEASVIVLLYHQLVPAGTHLSPKLQWTMQQDVFESEMKYIHDNGYHVVPMSDVLAFIHHQKSLPAGSVCITFDDGYKSPIVLAKPILDKYGYPWTFFIYPQFIGDHPTSSYRGAASWSELLELQKEGVDIECHSMTHPILTKHGSKSPDQYAAWLENETAGAKKILEQHMGKQIICFAYPYGEWNKQVQAAVIAAGFQDIFTVADNPVHSTTNPYSIGRYTITQNVEKNFAGYLHQSALSLTKADPEPGATISNPQPVITAVLTDLDADKLDPASLETQVRDMGVVKHDFDPATNTVRIYLPRPLIQHDEFVNIRVKDAKTGQIMVANWSFNYEPGAGAVVHAPIPTSAPAPEPAPSPASTNTAPSTATVGAPAQPKTD